MQFFNQDVKHILLFTTDFNVKIQVSNDMSILGGFQWNMRAQIWIFAI